MREFSEETLTEAVVGHLKDVQDARFRQVMESAIRHLHAFAREVQLTEEEWFEGIRFLTATGQKCDDRRQEFILLSDVLGLSMMVVALNSKAARGATESTVLGPFFVQGAPAFEYGADLSATTGVPGEPTWVTGRVLSTDGKPIAGASLEIWQSRADGVYDVQDPGAGHELRGRLRTNAEGRYAFRTHKPKYYPVPTDGPVGRLLDAMGRHPMRPAHMHAIVSAPGYQQVITHVFAAGDPYLDSDVVFAVKDSLIAEYRRIDDEAEAKKLGMPSPFLLLEWDFRLAPDAGSKARKAISAKDAAA